MILGLKDLEVSGYGSVEPTTIELLTSGATSLERCKLSLLKEEACLTLIQVLPLVSKVKELILGLSGATQCLKEELLKAFEKNSCLVTVVVYYNGETSIFPRDDVQDVYFSDNQLTKIRFYTSRNQMLPQMLLEVPYSKLTLSLLPQLFRIAKPSQMGSAYVLRSLLQLKDTIGPKGEQSLCKRRCTGTQ